MRQVRVTSAAVVLALPALGAWGSTATAAGTGVGQTAPSPAAVIGCSGKNLAVQDSDAGGPSYATTAGVLTSWSIMAGSQVTPIKLKIVKEGAPSSYTVTGSSTVRTPTPDTLNSFLDQIPVSAGDRLAIYVTTFSGSPCTFNTASGGDVVNMTNTSLEPDYAVGASFVANNGSSSRRLDLSAIIEPDAYGDGFGDVTQDGCPTRADKTTECTPPDTTVTAPPSVRTARKKAKVTILFLASEPGASFTCSVDGRPATPCSSPLKVKLKVGKHFIAVAAVDAAGNVDTTPGIAKVKVKRKKR